MTAVRLAADADTVPLPALQANEQTHVFGPVHTAREIRLVGETQADEVGRLEPRVTLAV